MKVKSRLVLFSVFTGLIFVLSLFQNCSAAGGAAGSAQLENSLSFQVENGQLTESIKDNEAVTTPSSGSTSSGTGEGTNSGPGGLQANGDGYGVYLRISSLCRESPVVDKIIKDGDKFMQVRTQCVDHEPIDVTARVDFKPDNPEVLILDNKLFGLDSLKPASFFCRGVDQAVEDGVQYDVDFSLTPSRKTLNLSKSKSGQGTVKLIYDGYLLVTYRDAKNVMVTDKFELIAYKNENAQAINYIHSTYDFVVNRGARALAGTQKFNSFGIPRDTIGDIKFSDPMHLNFKSFRTTPSLPVSLQGLTCFAKGLELQSKQNNPKK